MIVARKGLDTGWGLVRMMRSRPPPRGRLHPTVANEKHESMMQLSSAILLSTLLSIGPGGSTSPAAVHENGSSFVVDDEAKLNKALEAIQTESIHKDILDGRLTACTVSKEKHSCAQ